MNARPLGRQRGGETVEFAVTSTVLVLLFTAFVHFGFAFSNQAAIADASRAAAREVIRGGTDAEARLKADAVLKSVIQWKVITPYTCDPAKCPIVRTGADPGDAITATVNFQFQFPILAGFTDIPLSAQTVMRMLPN